MWFFGFSLKTCTVSKKEGSLSARNVLVKPMGWQRFLLMGLN